MEQINSGGEPQLTGNVLLYSKPEPLTREAHGSLGIKRVDHPWSFVASTHVAPLTVTEFAPAALSYPIIFVGDARTPVAVMGVREGQNLFVDDQGMFDRDAYIPAFVRRYPFVFANDQTGERMIVCIDRDAPVVGEQPEAPFFENGELSEFSKKAIKFCEDFETERRRTEAFVDLLKENDLFEVKQATFTPATPEDAPPATPQVIAEYFAVSEEKLNKLSPEKLVELRDNGALPQIYVHLMSLLGWERIVGRALLRQSRPVAANA